MEITTGITSLDAVVEVLFVLVGFGDDLTSKTSSVSLFSLLLPACLNKPAVGMTVAGGEDWTIGSLFRGLRGVGGEGTGLGEVTTSFSPGNFCDVR